MKKIIFNAILGLVLIYIWFRFVDLDQILQTLSKVSPVSLIPVFIFMLLSPILRAVRLQIFLSEIKKIPLKSLILLNGAALLFNFFIPIRIGEIVKGVYLNREYQLDLGKSILWIFLDRFVDFLAVLLLATVLFFIVPTSLSIMFITVIIVILSLGLGLTYLAIFKPDFSQKIIDFVQPFLIEKHIKIYFVRFSNFILKSFKILDRHPKDLALMILITFLAYGADAAIWYFTFMAVGAPQDYLKMYLGQLLSALTYLIPAAPGYIGSAEASGLLILSGIFGIGTNIASAMIVLFHIASAVFVIVFGLTALFSLKINLGVILNKALKRR